MFSAAGVFCILFLFDCTFCIGRLCSLQVTYWNLPIGFVLSCGGWRPHQEDNAHYVVLTLGYMHFRKLRYFDINKEQSVSSLHGVMDVLFHDGLVGSSAGSSMPALPPSHPQPCEWWRQQQRQARKPKKCRHEVEEDSEERTVVVMSVEKAWTVLRLPA